MRLIVPRRCSAFRYWIVGPLQFALAAWVVWHLYMPVYEVVRGGTSGIVDELNMMSGE